MTGPAMTELQGGQVTLADLFRVLSAIQSDLGKLATRLEVIDNRNKGADATDADHEQRLRALEAFKWKVVGLSMAISAITSVLTVYLSSRGH
jgi:hypothetical protein